MARDGMHYTPSGRAPRVIDPGTYRVAAMHLDHGHIVAMCQGLEQAGADIAYVFDPDDAKVSSFQEAFPNAVPVDDPNDVLGANDVHLVAAAAVPDRRGPLGVRVMRAGKDYFTDKAPFTEHAQLEEARRVVSETGRRYFVYYSERLHSESSIHAGRLVRDGAIGDVVQVLGLGPHRLNAPARPDWFFSRARTGGILCDIGSHQVEQFLFFAGSDDARVTYAYAGNAAHPDYPELQDFGEAALVTSGGVRGYFRVDWLTPDGLPTWGDGRLLVLGTEGYLELRKYLDLGREQTPDHLYLVNGDEVRHVELAGEVGYPFFGELIRDSLDGTETAMTQAHAFTAAELSLEAQALAEGTPAGPVG